MRKVACFISLTAACVLVAFMLPGMNAVRAEESRPPVGDSTDRPVSTVALPPVPEEPEAVRRPTYTADSGEKVYTAGTAEEFAQAIADIAAQTEHNGVIELIADVSLGSAPVTVQGKKVIITSRGQETFQLYNGSFSLEGDLTLDRIRMSAGSHKRIFACGHTFETTPDFQGFTGGEMEHNCIEAIIGGGPAGRDVTAGGTNLILRGNGTYEWGVVGGMDSTVQGDTHIFIDGDGVDVGNLIGGGWAYGTQSGQVHGDTHVTVRRGRVRSIVGGGQGSGWNTADRESARVYGDTWVVTGGGEGTAYIGTAGESQAGSVYSTVNNTHFLAKSGTNAVTSGIYQVIGGGLNDVVLGTTYVEVSGNAAVGTVCGGAAGNHDADISHTEIKNQWNQPYAVRVVYDSFADTMPNIYAGAPNAGHTRMYGPALVEVKQGVLTSATLDDSYSNGDSRSPGADIAGDAVLLITGGDIGQIEGCAAHYNTPNSPYHSYVVYDGCGTEQTPQLSGFLYMFEKMQLKNGAQVEVDLEKLGYGVQSPFFNIRDLEITDGSALTTRASNTKIMRDVTLSAGSWHAKGRVWVYEKMISRQSRLIFDEYTAIGYNHRSDADPSQFTAFTSDADRILWQENGYVDKIYGTTRLTGSDMTLMAPLQVRGDWDGGESLLRLPVTTENNYTGQHGSPYIPLNIDGTAVGVCKVRTVKPLPADKGQAAQMPAVGDNYVTNWKAGGTAKATFLLENPDALEQGLYLKQLADPADETYIMWQVAKRNMYTVQYTFTSGTAGMALPAAVTDLLPVDTQKYAEGTVIIAAAPALTTVAVEDGIWMFAGWDAEKAENISAPVVFTGTWTFQPYQIPLNAAPSIYAEDKTLTVADTFCALDGVTAQDREDGNVTGRIEVLFDTVDTSKAGVYTVTYKVIDTSGASSVKTITVTVQEKLVVPLPDPTEPEQPEDLSIKVPHTGENSFLWRWVLAGAVSLGVLLFETGLTRKQRTEE